MNQKTNQEPDKKRIFVKATRTSISSSLVFIIVMMLLFQTRDFIHAVLADSDSYEIRYETEDTLTNGQKLYRLYQNDEYVEDIDPNRYNLLDENGKPDIRYCVLMKEARNLASSIILGTMMIIVILILLNIGSSSAGTPFTRRTARRIRIIGWLQFALAIILGLVSFLMCMIKFQYVHANYNINDLYIFVIGFAIMVIAQVFDYGIRLQEDVDSIA